MAAHDLTVWEALLLGIVQGLTEWLPISSSGHLVLAQEFLAIEAPIFFELAVHIGTLVVVVVFFRATILDLLRAVATTRRAYREAGSWRAALWDDHDRRLALLVVAGTAPAAIVGVVFERQIESLFESARAVGALLLVMGAFLFLTRYAPPVGPVQRLGLREGLLIGAAQAFAILPGISRSGSTIGTALFLGVDRDLAVRYSFLLSIPAIAGATVFQAADLAPGELAGGLAAYATGIAAAMVVGYGALFLLVYIVRNRGFHYFAYYCWAAGALALALAT